MTTYREVLDAHPEFKRKLTQFLTLHDTADILDELKPPQQEVAAEYLREIANHLLRDAGLPEDFIKAAAASRPPLLDRPTS